MYFGNHRGDPAHIVLPAFCTRSSVETVVDIGAQLHIPVASARCVDRDFSHVRRNGDIGMCLAKLANVSIERKGLDTLRLISSTFVMRLTTNLEIRCYLSVSPASRRISATRCSRR